MFRTPLEWLAALSALLFFGCAGRTSLIQASAPLHDSTTVISDSAVSARNLADGLWTHRGHPDTARLALAAYVRATELVPTDPQLLSRLSRAFYLVANYVEEEPARKDSLFLKGVEAGERAMATHPGFRKVYAETKDEKEAVQVLDVEYIEALYWYSANLAKWAATKSIMVRLGNKSRLEAFNFRVLDLNEKFFHGAPHRFFGALPTKLPGGDMKLSRRHFEKALEIEPNYFGTRTLYAELYAVKERDKALFLKQIEYVLNTSPSLLPDVEPENRYEQAYARKLKERVHEWFE